MTAPPVSVLHWTTSQAQSAALQDVELVTKQGALSSQRFSRLFSYWIVTALWGEWHWWEEKEARRDACGLIIESLTFLSRTIWRSITTSKKAGWDRILLWVLSAFPGPLLGIQSDSPLSAPSDPAGYWPSLEFLTEPNRQHPTWVLNKLRNIVVTQKGLRWEAQPPTDQTPRLGRPLCPVLGTKESLSHEPDCHEPDREKPLPLALATPRRKGRSRAQQLLAERGRQECYSPGRLTDTWQHPREWRGVPSSRLSYPKPAEQVKVLSLLLHSTLCMLPSVSRHPEL